MSTETETTETTTEETTEETKTETSAPVISREEFERQNETINETRTLLKDVVAQLKAAQAEPTPKETVSDELDKAMSDFADDPKYKHIAELFQKERSMYAEEAKEREAKATRETNLQTIHKLVAETGKSIGLKDGAVARVIPDILEKYELNATGDALIRKDEKNTSLKDFLDKDLRERPDASFFFNSALSDGLSGGPDGTQKVKSSESLLKRAQELRQDGKVAEARALEEKYRKENLSNTTTKDRQRSILDRTIDRN